MPIRPEDKWLYPIDWEIISYRVRFERAKGTCERCGRPHNRLVFQSADGRWFNERSWTWHGQRGQVVYPPSDAAIARGRFVRVLISTAHLDHDPTNNRMRNLRALCQRCHLRHDRRVHRARARITVLMRRALGDLFLGPYRRL